VGHGVDRGGPQPELVLDASARGARRGSHENTLARDLVRSPTRPERPRAGHLAVVRPSATADRLQLPVSFSRSAASASSEASVPSAGVSDTVEEYVAGTSSPSWAAAASALAASATCLRCASQRE